MASTVSSVARSIGSIAMPLHALGKRDSTGAGGAQDDSGIGLTSFLSAVGIAVAIFAGQVLLFLLLRNKLARIFKPKTYLVPERERTESPPRSIFTMLSTLLNYSDREVIKKCGLDAYFFLRYLKTLLVIFIPINCVVLPILIPLNYINGRGHSIEDAKNGTSSSDIPSGLDTLAWGNVNPKMTDRYAAHLLMAILVVIWVCTVFFFELRVYIKVRQDYLTSAEHRLRASATTVLVNSIPEKWLSESAMRGLFDVFPGGIRNVWLNRDLSALLDKISRRNKIYSKLESAETELIKTAKKAQLKQAKKDEKKRRKELKLKSLTKQERAARDAEQDAEAKRMAASAEGAQAGDHNDTPHDVTAGVRESRIEELEREEYEKTHGRQHSKGFKIPGIGDPFAKVGHGLKDVVNKAGNDMDDTLETTNGFVGLDSRRGEQSTSVPLSDQRKAEIARMSEDVPPPSATETLDQARSRLSSESTRAIRKPDQHTEVIGNTVRKLDNIDDLYVKEQTKIWQFWKPPTGGYASPVPQGIEAADYITAKANEKKSAWQKFKESLPFTGGEEVKPIEYPAAFDPDYKEDQEGGAAWEKYLKKGDRPTHRLSPFNVMALPGIPLFTKKVDTIFWCREELARLNMEIEEDQKDPARFPLMNSAFIQFNHQVGAHLACQSVMHHIPKQMAPRISEVSPKDVIWDNMAMSWWQEWLRTGVVGIVVAAMVFLWAIPVAWTAALGQLDELIRENEWLSFLAKNQSVENFAKVVAGVLPAAVLGLLLFLIPHILSLLAGFKGAKTGSQRTEFVQIFYFVFLFIQVFLVVSIASFFAASIDTLVHNISQIKGVEDVLNLLATNLPKAANYFFSYMLLQALSTSSGTLLQIGALFGWFILARILDSTARSKWKRNTSLNQVRWGSFFPVYTNFACIGLIYSVIAPLISVFAVITFSLLYLAQRYSMLYVTRFEFDTGGVLYPRAINQTFTGLYVMELCLAGLFFIVQDDRGHNTCTTHGIIMIVVLILTIIYQLILNFSFSPLFRYLPITCEDEAVLRDEAFQRAQDRRLGFADSSDEEDNEEDNNGEKSPRSPRDGSNIEMQRLRNGRQGLNRLRNPVKQMGNWAADGGKQVGTWAKGGEGQLRKMTRMKDVDQAAEYRRRQREKDAEAQRAIGDALFGGIHDEIEDLTPDERDTLVQRAFMHEALRARRPTVWIPRDDIGVSDDEIRRTQEYSEHIWISNEGTALDSKLRVVYGKNPPDFSEVDLIDL